MSPRTTGITLLAYAALGALFRWLSLSVPVFKVPFLGGAWLGWILLGICVLTGGWLLWRGQRQWHWSPLTLKQFRRFRDIRRGYVSFLILLALVGVASLDTLIVGKRALMVRYEGKLYFPFVTDVLPATTFGLKDESETDYRELQRQFRESKSANWVLLPLVPYDAKLDTPEIIEEVVIRDGLAYRASESKPFDGRAYTLFRDNPQQKRQEWVYRHGLRQGEMRGWDANNEQVEKATFEKGRRISYTDYTDGKAAALESQAADTMLTVVYPPSPPSLTHRHFLGTTSIGGDVLAILFGGWQQAIIAAILFVTFVFVVGVAAGGLLGYFGGTTDIIGMRLIEIWSVLPFLFIVMIVSSIVSPNLFLLVVIIALFSWMGTTIYIRTAALKEKARDYVASARLLGASTGRIIFKHILPNSIAILVTLAPFEVSAIITSLAALDYLGFGLPPEEPSWGRLLHEGTEDFNYPWIVSSAFFAMTMVLVLVTFVGEAVREAFDPKKFTTYK
ncbi:ABC transporter permease subunit [Prosthecobacter sp.]|uniref:ABC transporter permease subunit n=1 Tax=Prosthecobacter sp. TaxID=1965333 RepID=UPI001DD262B1|nr:ABC transporter permease subunit [Prosthecobacter sp.]MCB1279382.1 ABC transporter permease subunit [Prosthecobacter sp.]